MATILTVEPKTGKLLRIATYMRNGKRIYQELPAHLTDRDSMSPRRLESLAAFAEAASHAYGEERSGDPWELPPAARKVAEELPEAMAALRRSSRTKRAERQEYLSGLVPADTIEQVERMEELGKKVEVRVAAATRLARALEAAPPLP